MTATVEELEQGTEPSREQAGQPAATAPEAPIVGEASGGPLQIVRSGLRLSPEFTRGIGVTVLLALIATTGRIVIPVAVQQAMDKGFGAASGKVDVTEVEHMVLIAACAVVTTMISATAMSRRLYRASEAGLAGLRIKAFRHVHDLSVAHQQAEQRGSLVSRVTSDVDTITNFIQEGGLTLVVSIAQMGLATIVMAVYSWQLTILIWVCFLPLFLTMRIVQKATGKRYSAVRGAIGHMLGAVSETLVGAPVVRAYGIEGRMAERMNASIEGTRRAQIRAQKIVVSTFSAGEIAAGLANAGVIVVGTLLGVGGHLTAGQLVAMLFLVSLFITPVQWGVEVLNEAQNAISGWRRVIGLLEAVPDVPDPGEAGQDLPAGPLDVRFEHVAFAYPGGARVLHDVDALIPARSRIAVVGETGSGKTTFAKLLTRLMDPADGRVLIGGVDARRIRFEQLRSRVVMVPQDGFLFEGTLADNVRYGAPGADDAAAAAAFEALGLGDWLAGQPHGVATAVGQRGESLSAGERQLVALARAYVADPDLLLLDEATSAVDPATEQRIARALEALTRGRTTVSIAHRLSTAQAADEVFVFDAGELVERGPHQDLVARGGIYAGLYASWARTAVGR
ncbi:ABC transporter ATP-binding protein [Actinospica durhamensis]|uniref:ABC transporter ATP-binding protein n=1 Tax=Actinospica durhamensis TaxID=1508375 RepID=A0A941ES65_9ACTN|nr:ABC transporter ATP-binding protein [Actinospica durhamensis]MBR7836198.1 ABC transporter ATP-binding protein [Actinospica durhamensis]